MADVSLFNPNPGVLTLAQLRLAARQEADQEQSQFISDDELNFYVNQSGSDLWDLLTKKYGDDYLVKPTPFTFATDGTTEMYPLPADFYKQAGVDLVLGPSPNQRVSLYPFNVMERNQFLPYTAVSPATSYGAGLGVRYKLFNNTLWLRPLVQKGLQVQLWYYPRYPEMADQGTIVLSGVVPNDTLTINDTTYTAVAGTPAAGQFQVGSSDFITAQNLATALNADAATLGILSAMAVLNPMGFAGNTVVQVKIDNSQVAWSQTGNHMKLGVLVVIAPNAQQKVLRPRTGFFDYFDGISGWLEYVIVDAAIKCLMKEESDFTGLAARKVELRQRIETMALHRDAGHPKRVVRSRNQYGPGFPGAMGGWGV